LTTTGIGAPGAMVDVRHPTAPGRQLELADAADLEM
jgi:hypothetical protein